MTKTELLKLVDNNRRRLAEIVGVQPQAVSGWPEELPLRIADRVRGAFARQGIAIPEQQTSQESAHG